MSARRLSQAIAEGDGISLLVEVSDAADALRASGAEGLVVRSGSGFTSTPGGLPVLVDGDTPDAAASAGADAVVISASASAEQLEALVGRAQELGLEIVLRVSDEDDVERVLEDVDPEILLLSADRADDDQHPLDRLLELLPDVPAGKLAIADLGRASRDEIEELERAGVDAVVVAGGLAGLTGDLPPSV